MLIAVTTIACGCKKYEEGPCISFRSAKNRIYGNKTLGEYKVNGADSLSQYYDNLGLMFNFFYNEDTDDYVCVMNGYRKDGGIADLYWQWALSKDKKYLNITWAGGHSIGVGPFGRDKTPIWEILKLKKTQLRLKTNFNNKEYLIELNGY